MATNGNISELITRLITGLSLISVLTASYIYLPVLFSLVLLFFLVLLLFYEWPKLVSLNSLPALLFTSIYPVTPFIILIALNHSIYRSLIVILFVAVFAADTGAYCIGKLIGSHRILPHISPKKTWEGFIGGYLVALSALIALLFMQKKHISWPSTVFITFIIAVLALAGDLFESYLKRNAGLKDTGNLLPGHGGVLDRFDSVLFVSYFFYFSASYLAKIFSL